MNNELTRLDNVLYGIYRPWLDENKLDEKFLPLIKELNTIYPIFKIIYEVDFYRPFNSKTEFYFKYIINETKSYCNQVVELIESDDDKRLQKYWMHDTLNNKLQTRLKDISKTIREKQLDLIYIDPHKNNFNHDTNLKSDVYIIQLLKVSFIRIYLEIQEVFKELLDDTIFIEDDLYLRFLNEPVPEKSFLKEAPENIYIDNKSVKPQGNIKPEFKPILDDNRPAKKGVPFYHDIVKNSQRFARFEEHLFLNNYIDINYSYCGKQGYKNQLAIIYHVIIEKQYFKNFNDSTKKPITSRDIVKFLNHRYDVDVDKQFRSFNDKIDERTAFVETTSWLFRLPTS